MYVNKTYVDCWPIHRDAAWLIKKNVNHVKIKHKIQVNIKHQVANGSNIND